MLLPNSLKPARGARRKAKKIGRGNASGHGNYSTRGGKGQTARSSGSRGKARLGFRRQMLATPKLRGFKSLNTKPAEVYLNVLEANYKADDTVTLQSLLEKKLVSQFAKAAKIIGTGELKKKLIITGVACTKGAKEKIIAVGGEVK